MVGILFLFNLYYNKILFNLPVTTGRLLGGDLSSDALREALSGYLLYAVLVIIQYLVRAYIYSTTTRRARYQLWGRMLGIQESFYDKVDSSEMLTAVTYDIASGIPGVVSLIVTVVPDLYYVVKALLLIQSYDFLLLLVLLVFLPLKYVYMIVVGRWVYKTELQVREKTGILTSRLDERLKNVSLIKAFNKEAEEGEAGGSYIDELYKANVAVAKLGGISLSAQQGIELLQKFIMMVLAVILLQKGRIDIAQWIAFFLFSNNLSSKFDSLIEDWMSVKEISGSLDRTARLYKAPTEDMREDGKTLPAEQSYAVAFDDVSFSYDNKKALNHVSFTVPEGTKVAIVGKSGSGKSTALSLIERFYEPESGTITVGNVPVSSFQMADYRSQIAYVPQSHQVFSGSIREALLYGNENQISDEILMEKAGETGFDQYIGLQADGLGSMIMGGESMSGGQLQKLIITREKMRDSRIVLLDEPASALDAESTLMVRKMVTEELKDKTVIMVTHDLSFVDAMDRIILLHDGELVAEGTYENMISNCPEFRELLESQGREVTA
ncbi:MAG: ABC transporter ATP-binding protein [Clostridiales bacterium]|nr:ABC transporter ATP-binding protein [Candidatus Blautia equi]